MFKLSLLSWEIIRYLVEKKLFFKYLSQSARISTLQYMINYMLLVFLSSKWPDVIVWNRLFHSSNPNYSKWNKSCNTWNVSNLPWLECYLEALIIFDRLFWHTFLNLLNFFFSIFSKNSNATLSQTLPPSKVCYSPWVKFIWSKVYSE